MSVHATDDRVCACICDRGNAAYSPPPKTLFKIIYMKKSLQHISQMQGCQIWQPLQVCGL